MDVHLELNRTIIRRLDGLQQVKYLKKFVDIYQRLGNCLEPVRVNQKQWKGDKTYLWHEDWIVVPSNRILALLNWTHESSGHVGADRTLKLFKKWFHFTWSIYQLGKPSSPSWTSARAGPVNVGISGTEVSTKPFPSHIVPNVYSMWPTRRCRSLGAMTSP